MKIKPLQKKFFYGSSIYVAMVAIFFLVGCFGKQREQSSTVLGDVQSAKTWAYLCGLTQSLDSPQEMNHRQILDRIGKKLGIKFIAVHPQHRCSKFANKLCWPQDTQQEVEKTYREIMESVGNQNIAGYIGFSNGGFFLNALAQMRALHVPIISVGAAGPIGDVHVDNRIYLVVGKHDEDHIEHARRFYATSKNTSLHVEFLEFDGGHEMPEQLLEKLLSD